MANSEDKKLAVDVIARIDKLESAMAKAAGVVRKQSSAMETRLASLNKSFANVGANVGAKIAGAFAIAGSAAAVTKLIDSSIKIQNQLKTTGLAGDDLRKVYEQLFASAQKNSTPLEALVTLYSRVSAAAKDLGANQADMLKFTDGVSLAMRVSGQSAEESAGALLQLSQALGDGKIQAEEYNSLLDGGRPILAAVSAGIKEAGGSISTLTKLVKSGQVSSEAFFRGFLAGAPVLQSQVAGAAETVSGSLVRLQNVLTDAAGRFDKSTGAAKLFGTVADEVSKEVNDINFDNLIAQVEYVVKALNAGAAGLQSWASAIGTATGLGNVGQGAIAALRSVGNQKTSTVQQIGPEGFRTNVYSQDDVQGRINGAFADTGTSYVGALTPARLQAYGQGKGMGVAPKSDRPAGPDPIKPVSLSDYAVPASPKKGGAGGGAGKDDFKRELESIKERTASLQAATAAQAGINPLINDYGFALAKAEEKQKLLNAAMKDGKAITPAMAAEIDASAEAYAKATAASERLTQSQQEIKDAASSALGTARDVTGGLIQDLTHGVKAADAFKNALSKIADSLLNGALDKLFSPTGGAGGGILSLLGLGASSAASSLNSSIGFTGATTTFGNFLKGIPGFATGTDSAPGGAALVGEKGPELVNLPRGAQVVPNARLKAPSIQAPALASRSVGSQQSAQPGILQVHITGASGDEHIRMLVKQGVNGGLSQYHDNMRRGGFGTMQQRWTSQKG